MFRTVRLSLGVLFLIGMFSDALWAQDWPKIEVHPEDFHGILRGSGGYFSPIKIGLLILLYFVWVKTTDWVNKDCQTLKLAYSTWNSIVFWPPIAGFMAAFTIPVFFGGYAVYFLSIFVPLLVYVFKRNSVVDPHERVLTAGHFRQLFSQGAKGWGVSIDEHAKASHEKGAPINFHPMEGSGHQQQSNMISARQSEGYQAAKSIVQDVLDQRADKAMLDYGSEQVTVRFQIDGVWHESEQQDREAGDLLLEVFKHVANLDVKERRKRQSGRFETEYKNTKYKSSIVSQGTKTGERVILQFLRPSDHFDSVADLGMREKMADKLRELLSAESGFVIFSSMPANGLSTTVSTALKLTDRYMRDFVALQEERSPEGLAENIDLTTWGDAKNEAPEKVLLTLIRKDPNGIVMNELPNAECVKMLCEQVEHERLIVTTIRAKEAVEALLRVLLLKVNAGLFAGAVTAVVNQRLIRTLCENCKEAYEPSPALLKKLGIPAGRIESLYRPPTPEEQDKVCPDCNGIGYKGRTSIFELLEVNQTIKDALAKQPKLDVLRQVARKTGNRNLQQEGVVLVARGVTSLAELQRVLKQ